MAGRRAARARARAEVRDFRDLLDRCRGKACGRDRERAGQPEHRDQHGGQ